ncbi:glycosyltransferase [Enterococcus gallinarum]|jgi:glycosyltransferase involved in cell wall biosynthesis|uniref:glycosyltransferase n=1 Tax=Enterococcus gallinarum TaxID=1353 RepID=UPI0035CA03BE
MREKLLVISYRAPYPIKSGDKIRMFQNVRILSLNYDVDLVYVDDNLENEDIKELEKYCNTVTKFKMSRVESIFSGIFNFIFKSWPLQVGYFHSSKMKKWIDKNISSYDKVFCNHLRSSSFILNKKGIKKYVDCVDAISLNYENKVKSCKGLERLVYSLELKKVKKYEQEIYSSFDVLFIISMRDKEYINNLKFSKEPKLLYNYVRDLGYDESKSITSTTNKSVCFIGKMSTEPNVNATMYFVNKIYPKVKKVYPDFEFNIIGGNATKEISSLSNIDGINVHGFVDDVAGLIQEQRLVVAPMVSGSGLQNKIIESMKLKKMVITTKIGSDGLTGLKGNELVIADNTDDFIDKLVYYLDDENSNDLNNIAAEGKKYVEKTYSFETVKKQLLDEL